MSRPRDAGQKGGTCYRTACKTAKPATWYNKSTREYYCRTCAVKINRANDVEVCVDLDAPIRPVEAHAAMRDALRHGHRSDSPVKVYATVFKVPAEGEEDKSYLAVVLSREVDGQTGAVQHFRFVIQAVH